MALRFVAVVAGVAALLGVAIGVSAAGRGGVDDGAVQESARSGPTGAAWLRAVALDEPDVPGYLAMSSAEVPLEYLVGGTGAFEQTLQRALVASFRRAFVSFDGSSEVTIELTEFVHHDGAQRGPRSGEVPAPAGWVNDPEAAAAVVARKDGTAEAYVRFAVGRVEVWITHEAPGPVLDVAEDEDLRQAVLSQAARIPANGDLTEETGVSTRPLSVAMWLVLLSTIVLLVVQGLVITVLRDRGTLEAIAARFLPPEDVPQGPGRVLDLSAVARRQRARARWWMVRWNVVVIAVFVAVGIFVPDTVSGVVVIGALIVAVGTAQVLAAALRPARSFGAPAGWRSALAQILGLAVSGALLGLATLQLTAYGFSLLIEPTDLTTVQLDSMRRLLFLSIVALVAGSAVPYRFARRASGLEVRRALTHDDRAEILLLRSFGDDRMTVRLRPSSGRPVAERFLAFQRERFEALVAWSLWPFGPVRAIADPGAGRLPPVGAMRVSYSDADWSAAVRERASIAPLVAFIVGRTPSLLWEVGTLRSQQRLSRCLFIFPPVSRRELRRRADVLCAALGLDPGAVPDVGLAGARPLTLRFTGDGEPIVAVCEGRDDIAYNLAITEAAAAIVAEEAAAVHTPAASAAGPSAVDTRLLVRSPRARDARRTRRLLAWVFVPLAITSVMSLMERAAVPEAEASMPGTVVARVAAWDFAVTDDGGLRVLDRVGSRLLGGTGGTFEVEYTFDQPARDFEPVAGGVVAITSDPWRVVRLDDTTGGLTEVWHVDLPGVPGRIAVGGGRVFVAQPTRDEVLVLEAGTGALVTSLPTAAGPWSVVADDDVLVVGSVTAQTVAEYDVDSFEPLATRVTGAGPSGLLIDGGHLYVVSLVGESLTEYPAGIGSPGRVVRIPLVNGLVAAAPEYLLTARYGPDPALVVIDRNSLTVQEELAVPQHVFAVGGDGAAAYASLPDGGVIVRVP